jgi:hypothetical protein
MPRLKYVGKYDEVECLGRIVKRGESAEFTDDEAPGLLDQPSNWQPVAAVKTKES